jgi:aminodeoxyfutalosine synthase
LLDNFDHIKAYWVTMGEDTASLALNFGAGRHRWDYRRGKKIMHAAQASSPFKWRAKRLVSLIREAGRVPVERDCLYNAVPA